ncbi:MAG: DUF3825 domain-containing protein [Oscillospiraceae bacterium]|nr:DUF3825 domain-containing protein [Oscillospiraceae bacterium]MCC8079350.1 DUF3825 domain-containing protein [Oscillospiraceae bacterium]MCD8066971.1 DUF3825 domain-containing protein [Oscillospiraceae bacterium]MCD8100274.1 DUF3825 domain-containing protein [Oscillospiraceae bacterium]MCD8192866.1 DUF3825 domain-containing protein [Oscillospiraceae bacterium]
MRIFDFAFCHEYKKKIQSLARMSPEKWSFEGNDNAILQNYIEYTFLKLLSEDNIIQTETYALFNTGLYTVYYEPIFAYFIRNADSHRQRWYLDGFYTAYQLGMLGIVELPRRANYFQSPADLVFDTNCDIVPQYQHIFGDPENYCRIPETVRDSPNKTLLFDGAIKRAKHMIDANYRTAVPQYYRGHIQLLIPLCLVNESVPDLALAVSKNEAGNQYLGHTCLTLDMAYKNARLIARSDNSWLQP